MSFAHAACGWTPRCDGWVQRIAMRNEHLVIRQMQMTNFADERIVIT